MDVLEQTSTRLCFQDRTVLSYWRAGCLHILRTTAILGILAAPFTLFGLGSVWMLLTMEHMITLTCERTESPPGSCQLVRWRFIGREVITIPLSNLQNATVQSRSSKSSSRHARRTSSYWVLLNTQTDSIRLTVDNLRDKVRQQAIATQINTFIKNPGKRSLRVQQKGSDLDWFVILVFVPLSLMPILTSLIIMSINLLYTLRSSTCTLDKALGTITVEHQGLKMFGNKKFKEFFEETNILPIEEIVEVQVKAFPGTYNQEWNLVAVLKSGNHLPLIWVATPGKEEKQAMANRLNQFLITK